VPPTSTGREEGCETDEDAGEGDEDEPEDDAELERDGLGNIKQTS
jgi:hypothetical protein